MFTLGCKTIVWTNYRNMQGNTEKLLALNKTTSAIFCCLFNNFLGNICAFAQKADWYFIRNYEVKIEENGIFLVRFIRV